MPFDLKKPILVKGVTKDYSWGKLGANSLAAKLSGNKINPKTTYAELWFGTHKNGISRIEQDGINGDLTQAIKDLPFLLKVLSIDSALSIQAHPNKEQALKLNKLNPARYGDSNHKPEIAFPITDLTLLYGFKSKTEIDLVLKEVPEFKDLLPDLEIQTEDFKKFCSALFNLTQSEAGKEKIKTASKELIKRLNNSQNFKPEEDWILKTSALYPRDIGLFLFYLMNLVTLKPGEAIFIEPGVLHAYLKGDTVEVMATSDNVVRAGLTQKERDIPALIEILDFKMGLYSNMHGPIIYGSKGDFGLEYNNLAKEFSVTVIRDHDKTLSIDTNGKFQILFSLNAEGEIIGQRFNTNFQPGNVFFLSDSISFYQLKLTQGEVYLIR